MAEPKKEASPKKEAKKESPSKVPVVSTATAPIKKKRKVVKPKPTQCKIDGCKRPYRAKGYCKFHYHMWRHGAYGLARYKTCKTESCNLPMFKFGLCKKHFETNVAGSKPQKPKKEENLKIAA